MAQLARVEKIWKQRLLQAASQRTPVKTEDTYHVNGSLRYAEAATTALYQSDNGPLVGYIIQATDVTERHLAEKQKEITQKRLNFVLEQSHTGSWELNLLENSAYRSPQHDQIFGYDKPLSHWNYEVFLEHVLPEDRQEVDQKFKYSIKSKTDWDFECRIKRKDGEIRWIWGSGSHQLDSFDEISSMVGIVQDITKRKQFEADKLHYAAELKSLFQALPDIYFQLKSDGTILSVQAYNQRQLYMEPKSFLGKKMQDILPPELGALFQDKLLQLERTQTMQIFTYTLEIAGELRHFDARLNQMSIEYELVCVVRDVTEMKKRKKISTISPSRSPHRPTQPITVKRVYRPRH